MSSEKTLEFSPIVREKMLKLKKDITDIYGDKVANNIFTNIKKDLVRLQTFEKSGVNIADNYHIETPYWLLFSNHNYFIYRFDKTSVTVVQMFNEKEDFMKTLFGISGRIDESIDFWGE